MKNKYSLIGWLKVDIIILWFKRKKILKKVLTDKNYCKVNVYIMKSINNS